MHPLQLQRSAPDAVAGSDHEPEIGRSFAAPPFQLMASTAPPTEDCQDCACEDAVEVESSDSVATALESGRPPAELPASSLADQGHKAIAQLGYARITELAQAHGLGQAHQNDSDPSIQRNTAAMEVIRWGLGAGAVASQADSPLPGPGDLIGLGIVVGALAVAGIIYMAAPGNQSDTGIVNEAQALIAAGTAATMCAALALLMQQARAARDRSRIQRIKKTQKAKGCRHSRHS